MPPLSSWFLHVNQFAIDTPWLHEPMMVMARYGLLLFAALALLGWWVARARPARVMACALLVPVAAVGASAMQQLIDNGVGEQRPYDLLPGIQVLLSRTGDPSFPSDHACIVGAVAAGLFFVDRRLGYVASALAVAMAFARVYCGVHWPLDVMAGLAFGAAAAVLIIVLLRRPVAGIVERLRSGSLHALVGAASARG